jgi:hypothetical protein
MSTETETETFEQNSELSEQMWVDATAPCPSWCVLVPGHRYESADYDESTFTETREISFIRYHQISPDADAGSANLTQEETWKAGVVILDAPVISVYDDSGEITSAEARKRAAQLLNLADQLDGITG